jgi:hypothetical protein
MRTKNHALFHQYVTEELNRRLIPRAAHEAIRSGDVITEHGVIRFGAWTFPATPAYLFEIFELIGPTSARFAELTALFPARFLVEAAACSFARDLVGSHDKN